MNFTLIVSMTLIFISAQSLAEEPKANLELGVCYVVEHIGSIYPPERICSHQNRDEYSRFRNQGISCARSADWFMFNENGQNAVTQMHRLTGIEAFPVVTVHYEAFEGSFNPQRIEVAFPGPNGPVEFELGGDCDVRTFNQEIPRHIASYRQSLRGSGAQQRTE